VSLSKISYRIGDGIDASEGRRRGIFTSADSIGVEDERPFRMGQSPFVPEGCFAAAFYSAILLVTVSNAFDCPKCPLSTASMTRFVSPGANHDNLSQQSVVFQLQQTFLDSLEYAADLHGLADRLESLAGLIISQQNQGLLSSARTSVASFVAQNVEVICSSAQSLMTFSNESVEALSCNLQDLLVEGAARPLKS